MAGARPGVSSTAAGQGSVWQGSPTLARGTSTHSHRSMPGNAEVAGSGLGLASPRSGALATGSGPFPQQPPCRRMGRPMVRPRLMPLAAARAGRGHWQQSSHLSTPSGHQTDVVQSQRGWGEAAGVRCCLAGLGGASCGRVGLCRDKPGRSVRGPVCVGSGRVVGPAAAAPATWERRGQSGER